MLHTAGKFSHCKGISTPEKELRSDHSIPDWFAIIILLLYNKYALEVYFLTSILLRTAVFYPKSPTQVCWKSLDLLGETFSMGLREKDVHGEVLFHLELRVVQLTAVTDRSHYLLVALFIPRLQKEKAFSPNGRTEVSHCREKEMSEAFLLLASEMRLLRDDQ